MATLPSSQGWLCSWTGSLLSLLSQGLVALECSGGQIFFIPLDQEVVVLLLSGYRRASHSLGTFLVSLAPRGKVAPASLLRPAQSGEAGKAH